MSKGVVRKGQKRSLGRSRRETIEGDGMKDKGRGWPTLDWSLPQ